MDKDAAFRISYALRSINGWICIQCINIDKDVFERMSYGKKVHKWMVMHLMYIGYQLRYECNYCRKLLVGTLSNKLFKL